MLIEASSSPYLVIVNDEGSLGVTADHYAVATGNMLIAGAGAFSAGVGQCYITPTAGEIVAPGQVVFVACDVGGNIIGRLEAQIVSYDPSVAPSGPAVLATVQPNYAPAKAGDAMVLGAPERDAIAAALLTLTDGVEVGFSVQRTLRVLAAILAGKTTTLLGNTTFRDIGDTIDMVGVTVTPPADRTSVTIAP